MWIIKEKYTQYILNKGYKIKRKHLDTRKFRKTIYTVVENGNRRKIVNLKTKIMIVRTIMTVLALIVIGSAIATFQKPSGVTWIMIGAIICAILAGYHESLVKKWKDNNNN